MPLDGSTFARPLHESLLLVQPVFLAKFLKPKCHCFFAFWLVINHFRRSTNIIIVYNNIVVYIVRVIKKPRPYPKYPRNSIPDLWYEVHAIVFEEHIGPHWMSEDSTLILKKSLPIYMSKATI